MKRAKSKKGGFKFRRKLAGLCFLAGFGITGAAQAQQPGTPGLPPKTYMKQSVFYLPVKIEESHRVNLREVRLYCKEGAAQPWQLKDKASPGQTYFTFRAPHDGEYWFAVVTVDKSGRSTPSDLRHEQPGLIVVQDTQLPQVDVQPAGTTDEGTWLQCIVRDANPDAAKTHFFYQTGDGNWQSLPASTKRPGQCCIPAQAVFTGMVRVEATDLAGNTMNREFNVGTMQVAQTPANGSPVTQASYGTKTVSASSPVRTPAQTPVQNPAVNEAPGQFPVQQIETSGPELVPVSHNTPATNKTVTTENKIVEPITDENRGNEGSVTVPAAPKQTPQNVTAIRHLVNKTHVFLNYQIENKGPSGVGKLVVYITRDQGQSWEKLGGERDPRNPIEIDLPGEGLYGVSLSVSNGRGFGSRAPAPGDLPEWNIEVDLTKPTARLVDFRSSADGEAGSMIISWKAQDKNLSGQPIDLYYSATREGPWQPIAKGLKNDGRYGWEVPGNAGAEAFIRLVAHDAAGNVTIVETAQGVTLDDHSRPRARVISVSTAPQQ